MATARKLRTCPRDPIGLSADEAAAFIGVSTGTFTKAIENGLMPEPFELFGRKIWHADEIDAAFKRLPRRAVKAQDDGDPGLWDDVSA